MAIPPFRADHIGSLLRPKEIKAARHAHRATHLTKDGFSSNPELRHIEDIAIRSAVALQEAAGLEAVTDGEYRRSFWHYDFLGALDGLDLVELFPSPHWPLHRHCWQHEKSVVYDQTHRSRSPSHDDRVRAGKHLQSGLTPPGQKTGRDA